jgi:hypothetical protein
MYVQDRIRALLQQIGSHVIPRIEVTCMKEIVMVLTQRNYVLG